MTSEATRRRIEGDRPAQGSTSVTERIANGQDALTTASTMGLLTKAYQLTHQMHGMGKHSDQTPRQRRQTRDLRVMRNMITTEILRRTDGQ